MIGLHQMEWLMPSSWLATPVAAQVQYQHSLAMWNVGPERSVGLHDASVHRPALGFDGQRQQGVEVGRQDRPCEYPGMLDQQARERDGARGQLPVSRLAVAVERGWGVGSPRLANGLVDQRIDEPRAGVGLDELERNRVVEIERFAGLNLVLESIAETAHAHLLRNALEHRSIVRDADLARGGRVRTDDQREGAIGELEMIAELVERVHRAVDSLSRLATAWPVEIGGCPSSAGSSWPPSPRPACRSQ